MGLSATRVDESWGGPRAMQSNARTMNGSFSGQRQKIHEPFGHIRIPLLFLVFVRKYRSIGMMMMVMHWTYYVLLTLSSITSSLPNSFWLLFLATSSSFCVSLQMLLPFVTCAADVFFFLDLVAFLDCSVSLTCSLVRGAFFAFLTFLDRSLSLTCSSV